MAPSTVLRGTYDASELLAKTDAWQQYCDSERSLEDAIKRLGLRRAGATPNQLPLSPARVWHMGSAKQSTGSSG